MRKLPRSTNSKKFKHVLQLLQNACSQTARFDCAPTADAMYALHKGATQR